ncbi:putative lipoprotein [Mycoplasmopsis meleagridis]|uniref:Lipoprotein-associated type-17 domain-containing protein n=1 Tax=Mycoplasmopsis meleagridis ATCC 25294 TaxID=1264554 RepID=A0A0F5H0Y9_9BACT|nr:lipoprotein 17-related variable surface protein [Mycoplasmopsis meleagridis]KKB26795.1 hypothetical protein MMELEA_01860 [Mycoplasmopsis meleagridis ATCC 25294]OAD18088.1 putative lipoprotein [Mycoplasmopsis meleagridis]VEU77330.1 Uncharacterised protein [Mycoplasmopsis meleagridis]
MKKKFIFSLSTISSLSTFVFLSAQCTSVNNEDENNSTNSKNQTINKNEELKKIITTAKITPITTNKKFADMQDIRNYNIENVDLNSYEIDIYDLKYLGAGRATYKVSIKDKATDQIYKDDDNIRQIEDIFIENENTKQPTGDEVNNNSSTENTSPDSSISDENTTQDNTNSSTEANEEFNEIIQFSTGSSLYGVFNSPQSSITNDNTNQDVSINIDKSSLQLTDQQRVAFTYNVVKNNTNKILKTAQAEITVTKPISAEEFAKINEQIIILAENKDEEYNQASKEELLSNVTQWTKIKNNFSKITSIIGLKSQESNNGVVVSYKIADNLNPENQSQEYQITFNNLPSSNEKMQLSKITVSYFTENANNTDANELQVSNIVANNTGEYWTSEIKFVNQEATQDEINNGYRLVSLRASERNKEGYKIVRKVNVHKSDKNIILKNRENIKQFKLVQEPEAKELLQTLQNGSSLRYDYKTATIYENKDGKRITLFTFLNPNSIANSKLTLATKNGNSFTNATVKLNVKDKKYGLSFFIGKYDSNPELQRYDNRESVVENQEFTILTKEELTAYAKTFANTIEYDNASSQYVFNFDKNNIRHEDIKNNLTLSEPTYTQNNSTGSVTVKYKLTQTTPNSEISAESEKVITGFKKSNLESLLNDVTVEINDKTNTLPSNVNENNIKLKKNNQEATFESGISISKTTKDANNSLGRVTVVITLTKDNDTFAKEYTIEGLKTGEALNFEEAKSHISLTFNGDKKYTNKNDVKKENINAAFSGEFTQKDKINLKVKNISVIENKEAVNVELELSNKENPSEIATYNIEIDGFAPELSAWAKKYAEGKKLFSLVGDQALQTKVKEEINKSKTKSVDIRIDSNIISYKGKTLPKTLKSPIIALNDEVLNDYNQKHYTFPINTHQKKQSTPSINYDNNQGIKSNNLGLALTIENEKVVIKYKLIGDKQKKIDTIYTQELF